MKRLLVYIAGPYRPTEDKPSVLQNVRAAEAIAIEVWQRGHYALCPHKNTAHFEGLAPDTHWLEGDMRMLEACDAIVLVPGWETSSGSRAEKTWMEDHGRPAYLRVEDLPEIPL